MRIYLRRDLIADSEEVRALQDTIKQQEELVRKLSTSAGGAQLTKANHSQKVKELSSRLKNGAHVATEKARLEKRLESLKEEVPVLEQAVADSAEKYQLALKELKELRKHFDDTYIAFDAVESK